MYICHIHLNFDRIVKIWFLIYGKAVHFDIFPASLTFTWAGVYIMVSTTRRIFFFYQWFRCLFCFIHYCIHWLDLSFYHLFFVFSIFAHYLSSLAFVLICLRVLCFSIHLLRHENHNILSVYLKLRKTFQSILL